jgi:glycosyltransferase involved in cell wall biosynthesis
MPLKILHIITRLDKGGSTENTLLTAIGLHGKYDVSIAYGYTTFPEEILIKKAKEKNIEFFYIPELVRSINPVKDIIAFIKIYTIIKKNKFDLVHTHCSKAGILGRFAAKAAKVKVIIHTPHGHVFYGYYNRIISYLFILIERIAAKITNKIITLTPYGIEEHIKYKIASREKFISIHSGVNLKKNFTENEIKYIKNELGIPLDSIIIGSIGRFEPVKGYKYMIEAARIVIDKCKNKKIKFVLAGSGSLYKKLKEQISKLNLNENFIILPWIDDTAKFISVLDIFVLPSLNEGMSKTLVQALILGKVSVATKVGGIPSIIKDRETGILVNCNSISLAEGIIELLNNENLCKKIKENIKKIDPYNFSVEKMIEMLDDLYEKCFT